MVARTAFLGCSDWCEMRGRHGWPRVRTVVVLAKEQQEADLVNSRR